ncbi:transcription repressor OFP6-like [Gossypium raimondii]|uniref:Transcription repressor n=1 Tax=Gossypium raimondii TaxID=29730 RepID=A0A0D2W9I3_GOSRA|nr:transcription repressor OFP6-like [Gossypium raimondii]KJB83665.1 hypothetical protein B456_013G257200 [Gossypium raimondii]
MSSNKKKLLKSLLTANARCGCKKLYDVHEPKLKASPPPLPSSPSPSSNFNMDTISSSSSSSSNVMVNPKIMDSIAVVKDSHDPYLDFRHSMLQMIEEKHIYSANELQELLQCFLELNSPCHHRVIVEAFMGI